MKRISIHITERQLKKLRQRKAKTGLKAAEIVRRAIDYYLEYMTGKK